MLILGIDEAGRGPVIGPMVIVGALFREKDLWRLKKIRVKDSKLILPKKREELKKKIESIALKTVVEILQPEVIDSVMESSHLNINWLEADTAADLINKLNPDKVIIDCPSNNTKVFTQYLKDKVNNKDIEIIAENKADKNHLVVSAASIVAKVIRDQEIEKIKEKVGFDFGSGYPSDERTISFLEKDFDKFPEFIRKKWSTHQRILKKKSQKSLEGFF